ncbi:hypothetical protein F4802DRAFT_615667 [Xylaria palmicola]|nr:hypothetical protein F4802DRAFT_615667 [Xylaria palmicola]
MARGERAVQPVACYSLALLSHTEAKLCPDGTVIARPPIPRIIADPRVQEQTPERPRGDDEIDAVTARPPVPSTRVITIPSLIAMDGSEGVNTVQTNQPTPLPSLSPPPSSLLVALRAPASRPAGPSEKNSSLKFAPVRSVLGRPRPQARVPTTDQSGGPLDDDDDDDAVSPALVIAEVTGAATVAPRRTPPLEGEDDTARGPVSTTCMRPSRSHGTSRTTSTQTREQKARRITVTNAVDPAAERAFAFSSGSAGRLKSYVADRSAVSQQTSRRPSSPIPVSGPALRLAREESSRRRA